MFPGKELTKGKDSEISRKTLLMVKIVNNQFYDGPPTPPSDRDRTHEFLRPSDGLCDGPPDQRRSTNMTVNP